jgi:hypothetical protein
VPVDRYLAFVNNWGAYAQILDDSESTDSRNDMTLAKNELGQWVFTAPLADADDEDDGSSSVSPEPNTGSTVPGEDNAEQSGGGQTITFPSTPIFIVSMTFPGAVVSADPEAVVSGNKVTWNLRPDQLDSNGPTLTATANPR